MQDEINTLFRNTKICSKTVKKNKQGDLDGSVG